MIQSNHATENTETTSNEVAKNGLGKLFFLSFLTLVLSVKGPLLLFAAIPMVLAFLGYGYAKSFMAASLMIGVSIGISTISPTMAAFASYGVTMVVTVFTAFLVASIVINNENPVRGIYTRGFTIVLMTFALLGAYQLFADNSLREEVTRLVEAQIAMTKSDANYQELIKAGGESARSYEMALSKPQEIVDTIMNWIFSATFVGGFFLVWISFFMILRNKKLWSRTTPYDFSTEDLVNFKVPEQLAYIVVAGLVFYLSADFVEMPVLEIVGMNIVLSLGVFYFFQGMGIYTAFLNHLNIKGFLRSFLTLLTIFFAFRFIAIVGFFDLWANFKKYLKKNEGDIS